MGLWVVLAAIPFINALVLIDCGATGGDVTDWLTVYLVVGLLVSGLSLLFPLLAHDLEGRAAYIWDGIGKLLAVAGWAVGLTSGVMFALIGTATTEVVIGVGVATWLVPPTLYFGWSVTAWCLGPSKPKQEANAEAPTTNDVE